MSFEQIINLLSTVSLVVVVAYMIGRNKFFTFCINKPDTIKCWLPLILVFGILSIIGSYTGVKINGALANTRMVGTLMAGFMGGPVVGFVVGVISGLYRYQLGGFTAAICGVTTCFSGVVAGLIRYRKGLNGLNWKIAASTALIIEVIQKGMIIFLATPSEAAWALERSIAIPTTAVTVLGSVLFIIIIEDIKAEHELYGAHAAKLSLEVASQTLTYLRHGLNVDSAQKTAQIIQSLTSVDIVMLTDRDNILATVGLEKAFAVALKNMDFFKKAISEKTSVVFKKNESNCASVAAPLIVHGSVVGTVVLARIIETEISEVDVHIVDGIANLLAVQIQLAEIDAQRKMREKAELKALQAQINPHFLFNTLNIIMSFCRTAPDTARILLGHLATIMHRSFANKEELVSLSDEMEGVTAYLEIVKARFGSRLTVQTNVNETMLNSKIPVLCIQPLVENAIQHGLFPKLNECKLRITIDRDQTRMIIRVIDNGVGMNPERLNLILDAKSTGIGIKNVHNRLKSIYGEEYGVQIESKQDYGTCNTIYIPLEEGSVATV